MKQSKKKSLLKKETNSFLGLTLTELAAIKGGGDDFGNDIVFSNGTFTFKSSPGGG
jgi:hypothetical protein